MSPSRRAVLGAIPCLFALAACRSARKPAARRSTRFDADDPAFEPDLESFARKRPAGPSDWLAVHEGRDVSFEEYVAQSPAGATAERDTLVLQPLGDLAQDERAILEALRAFTAAFFGQAAAIVPSLALPSKGRRERGERPESTQYQTRVILDEVLAPALPDDAIAYLGITLADLYPEPGWNFVFGQASLAKRVGVYSLARFFPAFYGEEATPESRRLGLLRSFKVLAHETGHMFSLRHCVRLECVMNGSNSLAETDRAPLHLCPVCLKKLQWNLRFDVRARYERLAAIYRREGFEAEAAWVERRRSRIGER